MIQLDKESAAFSSSVRFYIDTAVFEAKYIHQHVNMLTVRMLRCRFLESIIFYHVCHHYRSLIKITKHIRQIKF